MIKLYISIFFILWAKLLLSQTTVSFPPSADNTIYQDYPGNSNGAGDDIFSGNTGNSSPRRALFQFNLSSIPTDAIVSNVTLTLNCNRTTFTTSFNMSLHTLTLAWGEGSSISSGQGGIGAPAALNDATWPCSFSNGAGGCNTAWGSPGGTYTASPSATTAVGDLGNYSWTSSQLAADVQNWIANPATNFGWILIGDESQAYTAKRFGARETSVALQRPTLSVTYTSVLPVSLSFFNVQETKSGNQIRWQTVQEINHAFFNIEHSTDGINFSKLSTVNGRGNTSSVNDYQFMHNDYAIGKNFYRLAQTDLNRTVTYSKIILINNYRSPAILFFGTNLVNESINLNTTAYSGCQYVVYDLTGRPVMPGKLAGGTILLPLHLAGGGYFLLIHRKDGTTISGRFIKL